MDLYKSGSDIVRFAVESDVQIIADNMRESDKNEVWASDNITPIQAVSISFRNSAAAWTVVSEGKPVAMFGVCPIFWAGKEANVFLLATKDFCNISGKFLKRSRAFIKLMLECYPVLYNYVDCRNTQSIEWLEFCGAKFNPAEPFGIERKMFQYFEFRDELALIASKELMRNQIVALEEQMKEIAGSRVGDCLPLKHSFVDGAYVREIFMPKGMLLTSKIHKITHPYFVMKGDVSVLTEEGVLRIKGPFSGITKAGTKRVLYIHEDTIWITVHITKETELAKIEEEIIARSFSELPEHIKSSGLVDAIGIMED